MPFLGIAGIFNCVMSKDSLYQKAIDAYWNHVSRYHIWMNYYALFNGALFVGFCTLLTATTTIKADNVGLWNLENNYTFLQFAVCIIGLVSSFAWLASIRGHEEWEKNWMNIVESFEVVPLYRLIICKKNDSLLKRDYNEHKCYDGLTKYGIVLEKGDKFKAYSTHTITKIFVWSIIIGWFSCIAFIVGCIKNCCYACYCILISLYLLILLYFCVRNKMYSNVEGKILKIEE